MKGLKKAIVSAICHLDHCPSLYNRVGQLEITHNRPHRYLVNRITPSTPAVFKDDD